MSSLGQSALSFTVTKTYNDINIKIDSSCIVFSNSDR